MKNILLSIVILLLHFQLFPQSTTFYTTTKKYKHHIIEVNTTTATVYKVGIFMNRGGLTPIVLTTDTLLKKSDNIFEGKDYGFFLLDQKWMLKTDKNKSNVAVIVNNKDSIYSLINKSYYMKNLQIMSDSLHQKFPLYYYHYDHSFYQKLDQLPYIKSPHEIFAPSANKHIKAIFDSVSIIQTKFVATTNYIIDHAHQSDYSTLKDSLKKLPIEYRSRSNYFGKSVYQLSKANPNSFYRILEDFPQDKTIIYFAVEDDKELVKTLKKIEGNDLEKKKYKKELRTNTQMRITGIGMYVLVGVLITWLIVS